MEVRYVLLVPAFKDRQHTFPLPFYSSLLAIPVKRVVSHLNHMEQVNNGLTRSKGQRNIRCKVDCVFDELIDRALCFNKKERDICITQYFSVSSCTAETVCPNLSSC